MLNKSGSYTNIYVYIKHFPQYAVHFLIFHLAAKSWTKVCVGIGSLRMRSSDSKTFILDVVKKTFYLKTGNDENILIFINL